MNNTLKLAALAATAALLAACGTTGTGSTANSGNQGSTQNENECNRSSSDPIPVEYISGQGTQVTDASRKVCFPRPDKAWLKNGTFVNIESLRRMDLEMNEDQVRELISYPHFNEGFFNPSVWNYIFNFRTGAGKDYITCQYQVQFDDRKTKALFWNNPACPDILKPKVSEVVRTVGGAVVAPERFRLNADAVFAFDKSGRDDILAGGKEELSKLATDLKSKYGRIDLVTVTGHTDRLGSDAYNQTLSTARAATVRDYLIAAGLPQNVLRSYGAGKNQPVVQCDDKMPRAELIKCLQPNRRVEIEVMGDKRN